MEQRSFALVGALVGLVRAADGSSYGLTTEETDRLILESLVAASREDRSPAETLLLQVEAEKNRLAPGCALCTASCGRTENYDLSQLSAAPEEVRRLKTCLLFAIQDLALTALSAGCERQRIRIFYKALFALGADWRADQLQAVLTELETLELCCHRDR